MAAYSATRSSETSPPSPRSLNLQHRSSELSLSAATPAQSIRDSAFAFFLTIAIFSGVCFLAHLILIKLPLYRLIQQAQADASAISGLKGGPSARVVERKVRKLGLSIAWVFVVTLSVFPSITSAVLSTNGPDEANFMGLGTTLSDPALFVPLGASLPETLS